jgi:hypothetical protein
MILLVKGKVLVSDYLPFNACDLLTLLSDITPLCALYFVILLCWTPGFS